MAIETEVTAEPPKRRFLQAVAERKGTAKPEADKLTRPVSFRLKAADHAAYLAKVEASGMRPSAFFRDAVLANKTQVVARARANPTRARMVYLMNKASNNLNQLAHRVNADHLAGVVSQATYTSILAELQILAKSMQAVVKDAD